MLVGWDFAKHSCFPSSSVVELVLDCFLYGWMNCVCFAFISTLMSYQYFRLSGAAWMSLPGRISPQWQRCSFWLIGCLCSLCHVDSGAYAFCMILPTSRPVAGFRGSRDWWCLSGDSWAGVLICTVYCRQSGVMSGGGEVHYQQWGTLNGDVPYQEQGRALIGKRILNHPVSWI